MQNSERLPALRQHTMQQGRGHTAAALLLLLTGSCSMTVPPGFARASSFATAAAV